MYYDYGRKGEDALLDNLFLATWRVMADLPRSATPSLTRLVAAYFDESKKLQGNGQSVIFAGCAAHEEHWQEINRRWGSALARTGISTVKMSAALAFRDDFYQLKSKENVRDEILLRLATVIHESPLIKISSVMLAGDFEALPQVQQRKLRDQQYCGFEVCIRGLADHYPPTDAIQLTCDLTENYAEQCTKLFTLLRKREPDLKDRLLAICFADDKHIAGLQAADMIAYCARAKAEWERFGQAVPPIVQKIIALFESRETETTYFVYRAGSQGIGYAERD